MGKVAVLCTRVRVEEKQLLAAFAEAGVPAEPMSPEAQPLPIPRASLASSATVTHADASLGSAGYEIVIDRVQNRTIGSAVLRNQRAAGAVVIDSGLAATGTRLEVLHALAAAGLPLPPALMALSESAGLQAIEQIGYPSTVFPMQIGLSGIGLQDREIAEAILEHRETLGGSSESVFLVQGGYYDEDDLIKAIVVDGALVAYEGTCHHPLGFSGCERLAISAAEALGAAFIGVTLAHSPSGLVVWDVRPTPDFRHSIVTGNRTVAEAVAVAVQRRLEATPVTELVIHVSAQALLETTGLGSDIVLSA